MQAISYGSSEVDPNACVVGTSIEITPEEARALGLDVDADQELLEREFTVDVSVHRETVTRTVLHMRSSLERIWRTELGAPPGVALEDAAPPECPPLVVYESTTQLFTDDDALSGVFTTRSSATQLGSEPALNAYAISDLRNFAGTLPVAYESSRPFFADAVVQLYAADDQQFSFSFAPRIYYLDSDTKCIEPLCPAAPRAPLPLGYGINTTDTGDGSPKVTDPFGSATVAEIGDFVASMGPYRTNVRVWAIAPSTAPSVVEMSVRVDGIEVESGLLELKRSPDILTTDYVGGWLDLGDFAELARVEFEVHNSSALADVQSRIVVGGCLADGSEASARCFEPDCIALSAVSVVPARCSGQTD